MRAARWYGRGDVRICDVPEPQVIPGHVKIEVKWCGICGSDVAEYLKGPMFMPAGVHPVTGCAPPITVGHEFSGVIVELGDDVSNFAVGDRVVVDPYAICGECFWCRRKEGGSLCERLNIIGFFSDGGFAKYVVVPGKQAYHIGDLSFDVAALTQLTVLGVHITRSAMLKAGETALIIGAGPIGLANLQAGKNIGAKVIIAELSEARRRVAREFKADMVLDPRKDDIAEAVLNETEGRGADVALECVGNESTMHTCFELTRKGGRIVAIGFSEALFPTKVNDLIKTKRKVIGTLGYGDEFGATVELLQKTEHTAREMITARIQLEDIVDKGYEELVEHKDKHIKILVKPE